MAHKQFYVGLTPQHRMVFSSQITPTEASHGDKYNAVIGPFATKRGAIFMQEHGAGNPHCRNVAEAEKLGRIYSK